MATKQQSISPDDALQRAFRVAGGREALSKAIGLSRAACHFWKRVPPTRVLAVERLTGVSRHELRPDLYPEDNK